MNIQIKGLTELVGAFQKAHVELPSQLKNAMTNSVRQIRTTALSIVPVQTSMLKNSIQVDTSNPLIGKVTVGQPYGKYVEFGTGIYATKGGGRQQPWRYKASYGFRWTKGMKAQPFMKPALENNTAYVKDQFDRAIKAVINMLKR